MKIARKFTTAGKSPFDSVEWGRRSSRIANPDGSVVFEMHDAEVPAGWSQLATDIMVSKYFRKAGVPQTGGAGSGGTGVPPVRTGGTPVPPEHVPPGHGARGHDAPTGPETSARQVIHRLAGCWKWWGEQHGYFDSSEDAQAFYDELVYMMLHQMAAPNSPQWFNTGLNWAYGVTGPAQGHCYVDPASGEVRLAEDAYTHPQPHACFIQSITDDLVNPGGIMDLWTREARLFKYGSGTGTNFSALRGEDEPLSGGGKSSGLMSWLKIGDRAAGAIKSGGTTRRAAKMVCLDLDHPDIEKFVNWKVREEIKVAAMVEGMKRLSKEQRETAQKLNLKLDYDFNGEAYQTVSGQNSNNSVRIPDAFFDAVDGGGDWPLRFRTLDKVAKTLKASDLWDQIGFAAWRCADPGVQYDTTINAWHTCPQGGRINASNPCVTGDTLVATTAGHRRIDELVGQSLEIIGGDGRPAYVDRVFKTGTKPVFTLRTRAGYTVRLTADHPVFTLNRGDVLAAELTKDDIVQLRSSPFGSDFAPPELAELAGAALGDGCIAHQPKQDTLSVVMSRDERDVAETLRAHIDCCKQLYGGTDGRAKRATGLVETATGVRVGTSVRAVLAEIERLVVLDRGSEGKAFSPLALRMDRATQAALLRGLFTADGTVADYGAKSQYVALDSASLDLLRQVQLMLLGFGVKAKIYENRRALSQTTAILPDGRGGTAEYPVRQIHSLRISRSSRVAFERAIGFIAGSAKSERLRRLNAKVSVYADRMVDQVDSLIACGVEDVFDLTEPRTHHFVANGIVVHNCSEYMFLDDTACNLASINLLKFYDAQARTFDVASYEHAVDVWTVVLEISVLMAAFPSEEIARRSYDYRTLGLGHANIGAMLMQAGVPYDSDEARALCAMLTSVMCGRAYRQSAVMAKQLGAFPRHGENAEDMLRVIRNHRRAARGVARHAAGPEAYEHLRIRPVPIDHAIVKSGRIGIENAGALLERSAAAWDEALALGEKHGFRNAQVTVIAPTGTIGLLMDCDTTGVEPDFALVKFKKLAGGGYFKIANASLKPALVALGYGDKQVREILTYVLGALRLDVPMPDKNGKTPPGERVTFADWLKAKGLTSSDLKGVAEALPTVFELPFAFNAWALGEEALKRLSIDAAKAKADPSFNLLSAIGLTKKQIEALNELVCGAQTVEGAPHLKAEHLPVFDCASRCGRKGKRLIAVEGHIRMMAAAQPFISGAISKTINLPSEATVDDIKAAYRLSWELGLKANALYRDGCKLSQPLSSKSESDAGESDASGRAEAGAGRMDDAAVRVLGPGSLESRLLSAEEDQEAVELSREETAVEVARFAHSASRADSEGARAVIERIVHRPLRRRLPDTRRSITHKFNIAGMEGYLTVGLYEDGLPGELFITMAKEGSTIGGLMDSLGTATSVALQYGVPIESLVNKFAHQRFEPAGMTTNRDIPFAKSLVDYIFRWLGMQFVPGYRDANAPKRPADEQAGGERAPSPEDSGAFPTMPGADRPPVTSIDVRRAPGGAGGAHAERKPIRHSGAVASPARSAADHYASVSSIDIVEETRDGVTTVSVESHVLSRAMRDCQGDAPACDTCGTITVRNGACYKCLNCGHSMGCS